MLDFENQVPIVFLLLNCSHFLLTFFAHIFCSHFLLTFLDFELKHVENTRLVDHVVCHSARIEIDWGSNIRCTHQDEKESWSRVLDLESGDPCTPSSPFHMHLCLSKRAKINDLNDILIEHNVAGVKITIVYMVFGQTLNQTRNLLTKQVLHE